MLKKLIQEFNEKKNDVEKYRFLLQHPGVFKLHLDNDYTCLGLADATCEDLTEGEIDELMDSIDEFDEYLGGGEGILDLLGAIGIIGEPV